MRREEGHVTADVCYKAVWDESVWQKVYNAYMQFHLRERYLSSGHQGTQPLWEQVMLEVKMCQTLTHSVNIFCPQDHFKLDLGNHRIILAHQYIQQLFILTGL